MDEFFSSKKNISFTKTVSLVDSQQRWHCHIRVNGLLRVCNIILWVKEIKLTVLQRMNQFHSSNNNHTLHDKQLKKFFRVYRNIANIGNSS